MKDKLKVRDVSLLTGVPEHALRFYEKYDIITPERGSGNYRHYAPEDLYRIMSARAYRGLGFSLRQCKELIDQMNHAQQREALEQRYEEISKEIFRLNCMQENLRRRLSEYENARRLKYDCQLVTLPETYWLYSHGTSREVDLTRLDAELMARVMDPLPFMNMEAHVSVDSIENGDPLAVDWGVSFEKKDCALLDPEDVKKLTYTPSQEYVLHTYLPPESADAESCILAEAFSWQKDYAREHGLRVSGTAIIRMLPGIWNGEMYQYRLKLCYLPVVRETSEEK